MKKILFPILALFITFSCQQDEDQSQPTDFGYLSMTISITVTSEEADGRTEAVDTDNFRVAIFDAGGTEIMVFDPFSSAPAEVALPTGEYYVEAHSNNLVDAAFDNPFYFGRSVNFTIDKEETKTVDIVPELANTKVAILYSDNVVNTFDSYTGMVTVVSSGASLLYDQGETREGYFITSPLEVAVNLSYTKLDGTTIDRTFTTTIDDPQPKTLYNINVDATLENGVIIFNIVVDDSFDTIDIDLGDSTDPENSVNVYKSDLTEFITSSRKLNDGYIITGRYVGAVDGEQRDQGLVVRLDEGRNVIWEIGLGVNAETFNDVIQTLDGGFLVAGFQGETTNQDIWLVKLSSQGNVEWEKTFGGTSRDAGSTLVQLADGNILLGSWVNSTFPEKSVSLGGSDAWVVKMDGSGNIIWETTLGGIANEILYKLKETSDGSIVGVGTTYSGLNSPGYSWVFKLSTIGTLIWENDFGAGNASSALDVIENGSGFTVLTINEDIGGGATDSYGLGDNWILELDANGNLLNQKVFGGTGADRPVSFVRNSSGELYVLSQSTSQDIDVPSNFGSADFWIYKLDISNNIIWSSVIGGSSYDDPLDIFLDESSGTDVITAFGTTTSNDGGFSNRNGSLNGSFDAVFGIFDIDGNVIEVD